MGISLEIERSPSLHKEEVKGRFSNVESNPPEVPLCSRGTNGLQVIGIASRRQCSRPTDHGVNSDAGMKWPSFVVLFTTTAKQYAGWDGLKRT